MRTLRWNRRRRRERGHWLRPFRAAVLQFGLDLRKHLRLGQSVFGAKTHQIFFFLGRERSVGDGEGEIFLKFGHRLFMFLGCQLVIHRATPLRIEKFDPGLGQIAG